MRAIWCVVFAISCAPAAVPSGPRPNAPLEVASPPAPLASPAPGPLAIASEPRSCTQSPGSREVLDVESNAGSVKLIPSANGLDMFWTHVARGEPEAQFALMHVALAPDGQPGGKPQALLATPMRNVAVADPGTFGLTYQRSSPTGSRWRGHVAVVRGGSVLWDAALPNLHFGHGTLAIGWDPGARQWLVVGEELFQLPKQPTGHVYNRLFMARFDEHGQLVVPVTYLSEPFDSASLSDWSNPLIWAGDRFAVVWQLSSREAQRVFVTEIAGQTARHIPITTAKSLFRGVIARTRSGYVLAGGEQCTTRSLCSRVVTTELRDGIAAPIRYLSDERMHATEALVASDGTPVAVAWHESDITTGTNRGATVYAALLDGNRPPAVVAQSKPAVGQHDWVQSLVWDGCRFVLAYTKGINPSRIQLVMFP